MARNMKHKTPHPNGLMSKNEQDPIFGGDINKIDCDEEPIGIPDQQHQTINLGSSNLSATRKRKGSDSPEYDQEHRVLEKRSCEDGYPNKSKLIRLLCLFNYCIFTNPANEERKGSECDVSSLDATFSKLGYKIASFVNLSREKTLSELERIRQLCNKGGIHSIVLAFMSHGDGRDPDNFLTSDDNSVSMSQVRNLFNNGSCKGLRGKPKLFFGIFCRDILENREDIRQSSPAIGPETSTSDQHILENNEAENDLEIEEFLQMPTGSVDYIKYWNMILRTLYSTEDHTSMMETDGRKSSDSPLVLKPDDLEDMTTIYSTKPGRVSYRHPRNGSVMVQCLCRVLEKYGKTLHLNNLYSLLERKMEEEQTRAGPEYSSIPDREDLELKTFFIADP